MNNLESLQLCIAICYICDISGVMQKLSKALFSLVLGAKITYTGWSIPLLSCGLCTTFWAIFILNLIFGTEIITALFLGSLWSILSIFITKIINLTIFVADVLTDNIKEKLK